MIVNVLPDGVAVVEVVQDGLPNIVEVVNSSTPYTVEVIQDNLPNVVEVFKLSTSYNVEVLQDSLPNTVEVLQSATPNVVEVITAGPRGPQGFSGENVVAVKDEGNSIAPLLQTLNFSGSGVTAVANGTEVTVIIDGAFVSGGTNGLIPLWSGSTALTSSIIRQVGDTLQVSGSVTASSFTGSLLGTASYAQYAPNYTLNSSTSSMSVLSASYSNSSSYSSTASYAPDYVLASTTGSLLAPYVLTNSTSSMSVLSASYALASSNTVSASYALSSSYTQNAATASNILGGKATYLPYFITDTTLATSSIYQSGSYSIIINQDNNTSANPEALYVWQPHPTSINVISGKGNLNNYLQLNIHNTNQGTAASSDVVATANNGNETINYIDMGINSENFSGDIGGVNDAYLYSTGRHLHIGNVSNYPLQFFVGGISTDTNRKFELNANGQHNMTGSLEISGSLKVNQGITGSLFGTSSYVTGSTFTSANPALSASYALTASYAPSYVLNSATSSFVVASQTSSFTTTSSFNAFTSSYNTGSFTGSFTGTLTGTASYSTTSSYSNNSTSASYALTASYALNAGSGGTVDTGSLLTTSSFNQYTSSNTSQFAGTASYALTASFALNGGGSINTSSFVTTSSFNSFTSSYSTGSFTGSFVGTHTGSLFGTASYAISSSQAISSSYSQNSTSASYAQTASHAPDYTLTSVTGSMLAPYVLTSQTSSMSVATSSYAQNAQTASYVLQAVSSSYATSASYSISSSQAFSSITASYVTGSIFTSANPGLSSSYALSASYAFNSTTASYVTGSVFTSNNLALSSSYALTASYAPSYLPLVGGTVNGNVTTNGIFTVSGSQQITGSLKVSGSITGSLFGTASYVTGSIFTSNNPALTASFALVADRAQYAVSGGSPISVTDEDTTLLTPSLRSLIFSGSGVNVTSEVNTITVYIPGGTTINTGSLVTTSSFNQYTSSKTSQFAGTASYALTASYVMGGGGGGSAITVKDEETNLTTTLSSLNFAGNGVSASVIGNDVTVTIAGGGGSTFPHTGNAQITGSLLVTDTVQIGTTGTDSLQQISLVASSILEVENLYNKATGSYTSAFVKYTLSKGTNARAGEFVTVWNGTTATYYDNSTTDIGNTADVVITSAIVSSQIKIDATCATSGWKIKTLATFI